MTCAYPECRVACHFSTGAESPTADARDAEYAGQGRDMSDITIILRQAGEIGASLLLSDFQALARSGGFSVEASMTSVRWTQEGSALGEDGVHGVRHAS